MFLGNVECLFDTEHAITSAIITHTDPYAKLVNPVRWGKHHALHREVFRAIYGRDAIPEYISFHTREFGSTDYSVLYSVVRGVVSAFLAGLDIKVRERFNKLAQELILNSTHLFCQYRFPAPVMPTSKSSANRNIPLTIIIPFRAENPKSDRLRNLIGTLVHLRDARIHYPNLNIIVVESDSDSRYKESVEPMGAVYRFHRNAGPFNKSAAINLGFQSGSRNAKYVCILDSDARLDETFLPFCINELAVREAEAFMPFRDMFFADINSSNRLRTFSIDAAGAISGYLTRNSPGGCIWVSSAIFDRVGGFDEGYVGWGGEDRDFYKKVEELTDIIRSPGVFLHLFHERAPEIHAWADRGGQWAHNYNPISKRN